MFQKVIKGICTLVVFAVLGCCPRILPPTEIRDSVRVEIRERIIRDTAFVESPREIERIVTRDTSSHLENSYAKSDAVVSDGFLFHSLESIPQIVEVPYCVEVHDTTVVKEKADIIVQREIVERELTWFQQTQIIVFWIAVIALALFLAYRWLERQIPLI